MFVIGHRGYPVKAPENTLPSFMFAINSGVDFVEFDVRKSKDGEIVVIHDRTVDRTTNSKGFVSDFTISELKALDAGGWFNHRFRETKIPTLNDVLSLINGKVSAVIDIKECGLEERVLNALEKFGMINRSMIVASPRICRNMKNLEPEMKVQSDLEYSQKIEKSIDKLITNLVDIASINVTHFNVEVIKLCHKRGLLVNVWPVNNFSDILKCVKTSVNFITTDNPGLVIEVLHKLGYR